VNKRWTRANTGSYRKTKLANEFRHKVWNF